MIIVLEAARRSVARHTPLDLGPRKCPGWEPKPESLGSARAQLFDDYLVGMMGKLPGVRKASTRRGCPWVWVDATRVYVLWYRFKPESIRAFIEHSTQRPLPLRFSTVFKQNCSTVITAA